MIKQNLIVYAIPILFEILKEIEKELNYEISFVVNKKDLSKKNLSEHLILAKNADLNSTNVIELNFPFKLSKLIEKINIKFMKLKSKEQSNVQIGNYLLNINARKFESNSNSIHLTEKEVNILIFLKNSNESVNIERLQEEVWGYKNQLESHTVETHIHRLRKKLLNKLNVTNFLLSDKKGYYLKLS